MKVLMVVNQFPVLSETFILDQIVGLCRRDHDVTIMAGTANPYSVRHADVDRYHLLERLEIIGTVPEPWAARARSALARSANWGWRAPAALFDSVNLVRYGRQALNLRLIHERLPAWSSTRRYDVIHCHFGPNGLRAVHLRSAFALDGPIITSFHGYDINALPRIFGNAMYRPLFQKGDLFTIGSEFLRQRVLSLGAPEGKIAKHPMGVNLSIFPFRERTGSADGTVRLLTVARLIEVKGVEVALRAVALARRAFPNLTYTVIGDGPLRRDLQALADELGIADSVIFEGQLPRERVIDHYRVADLFLLPSVVAARGDEENQPVALAEAQACGLPVVASRIGGIPESMRDGESGILVPAGDAGALAAAIVKLATDRSSWARMGRSGREIIEEQFDVDKLNAKLEQTYLRVSESYHSKIASPTSG